MSAKYPTTVMNPDGRTQSRPWLNFKKQIKAHITSPKHLEAVAVAGGMTTAAAVHKLGVMKTLVWRAYEGIKQNTSYAKRVPVLIRLIDTDAESSDLQRTVYVCHPPAEDESGNNKTTIEALKTLIKD
eukprot:sb/3475384/